jgi:signal transduction histidine kinase
MPLSHWLRSKLLNSFLIWFAATLILLQTFLLGMVLFVLLRPSSDALGQTFVALYDAIAQIERIEGPEGGKRYLESIAHLNRFTLLDGVPEASEKNIWYPTFKSFERALEQKDGDLRVVYSKVPVPSAYFYKPSNPQVAFGIELAEPPFIKQYLWLSIFTVLLTLTVSAFWIYRRIANPLIALSAQAKKMADGSDTKKIFVSKGAFPEINQLASSLNYMRAELDRSIDEREQFLAMVSHDLRTPLSRMSLWLDIGAANGDEEINGHLKSDIEEMRSFLEQFVELTKLNGEVGEEWVYGDLSELLQEFKERYQRVGSDVILSAEKSLMLKFKPVALTRLLYNLTDNAIRYGSGSVHISAVRVAEGISLTISNPVLMTRQVLGVVDAFKFAKKNLAGSQGVGLGLKIVKQFANVHGAMVMESIDDKNRSVTITFFADIDGEIPKISG